MRLVSEASAKKEEADRQKEEEAGAFQRAVQQEALRSIALPETRMAYLLLEGAWRIYYWNVHRVFVTGICMACL